MLRIFFTFVMLFVGSGLVYGQAPPDKFIVPTHKLLGVEKPIPLGKMARVTLDKQLLPPHFSKMLVSWSVFEPYVNNGNPAVRLEEYAENVSDDKGDRVFWAVGITPTTYVVQCVVTYVFEVRDGPVVKEVAVRQRTLTGEVHVGGESPKPPKPPHPDEPLFNNDTAKAAYNWVVKTSVDKAKAKVVAEGLRGVVAQVGAGTVKDFTQFNASLKEVVEQTRDWHEWFTLSKQYLNKAAKDGNVKSVQDASKYLEWFAEGLEQVR